MAPGASRFVRSSLAALALAGLAMPVAGQAQDGHFVVKDMRAAEKDAVLIMAARGVERLPVIVLFGANRDVLNKVRAAALESERAGYRVRAILVGPVNLKPSLEIFANTEGLGPSAPELGIFDKAWKVSKPINPYVIKQSVLVTLIREVHQEYYAPP